LAEKTPSGNARADTKSTIAPSQFGYTDTNHESEIGYTEHSDRTTNPGAERFTNEYKDRAEACDSPTGTTGLGVHAVHVRRQGVQYQPDRFDLNETTEDAQNP
jgi:hypothetical protein